MRRTGPGRWWAFVPVTVWAALLLWLGSRPTLPMPPSELPLDKVAHFSAYGVLGLLLGFGWWQHERRPAAWILLLLGMLVGAADELHQTMVPGRSAELADFVADAAGVLTGFWLSVWWLRRRTREGA
jgi:VanZ family protein